MNIQYYLIHGIDKERGPRMIEEFKKWNLNNDKVKWVLEPNCYMITEEIRNNLVMKEDSYSCGVFKYSNCPHLGNGHISCTYKHYLCLKDVIENDYDYGVIMEDNQYFCGDIDYHVNLYIEQLNNYYPDWDILFDTKWNSYKNIEEEEVIEGKYVYPKSNEINKHCHGGTRLAQFYILKNKCAKKLYENYIPFNNAPDWWMNDLFRNLNIKSYWSEPSISNVFPHISTAR